MDRLPFILSLAGTLGCGLIAGVFFAFSTSVMTALGRRPAAHAIGVMQAINVVILNRWFLGTFLGTAALGVIAVAVALWQWRGAPAAPWMLAGGVLYVAGTFGVTIAFNVPRNEALARLAADDPSSADAWGRYLAEWTWWNHVRTVAALAAAACFAIGLAA